MMPWFVWKNKNSLSDFGLWINKLPPIVRAPERVQEIVIPGRAGSLTMAEGDDIYDGYVKECIVLIPNTKPLQPILSWLRGTGDVMFCNEAEYAYEARIAGEVSFERIGNNLLQATIPFAVKPFKKSVNEAKNRISTYSLSVEIFNPGDIESKPKIYLSEEGSVELSVGNTSMTLNHVPFWLLIDCDAGIFISTATAYDSQRYYYIDEYVLLDSKIYRVTEEGIGHSSSLVFVKNVSGNYDPFNDEAFWYEWKGSWSGEFLRLPKGKHQFIRSSNTHGISIDPRWRWV